MLRYPRAGARAVLVSLLVAMLLMPTLFPIAGPTTVSAQTGGDIVDKFGGSHVVGFTSIPNQPNHAAIAKDAGLRWTKEGFGWNLIERSQGVYSFDPFDIPVDNAVAGGLSIIGELGLTAQPYANLAPPGTPDFYVYPTTSAAGYAAWQAYIRTVVGRYKDRIHVWQVWPNVDDYVFWKPFSTSNLGAPEYNQLLIRAYQTIKSVDPTATVVTASMDPPFLNALLDNGGGAFFDAIGVHNYAEPFAPEVSSLTTLRLASLADVSQRRAGGKPMLVSEYGWPSAPGSATGISEAEQAAYLNRSMIIQGARNDVQRMFWTDFQDQAVGGSYSPVQPEDNFGMLLKIDDSKKISFTSFKAMTTALSGATFARQIWPATTTAQTVENFETGRAYELFTAGGASGALAITNSTSHSGANSARLTYNLTNAPNTTVVAAPLPGFVLPVSGTPARIRVWARGDGGPPAELTIGFTDAQGEVYEAIMGLISGTDWKEYIYTLDAVPGTSVLARGNLDNVIQYPIVYTGFAAHIWTNSSPVGSGNLWIDDIQFESGPSVFDYEFSGAAGAVHALWSLQGSVQVPVSTPQNSVTVRDSANNVFPVQASNGVAQVTVSPNPIFVSAGACNTPRPAVQVTTSRSGSKLAVSVTATGGTLKALSFFNARNASVEIDGVTTAGNNFVASIPIGVRQKTFLVSRSGAGAVTVPFIVTDDCGQWKTFVGFGTSF